MPVIARFDNNSVDDAAIVRSLDPAPFKAIYNHPEVRPYIGGDISRPYDCTPQVTNRDNVALLGQWGVCVFVQVTPGIYEMHPAALPQGRGPWAYRFMIDCARYMMVATNCWEVCCYTPKRHFVLVSMMHKLGMVREFSRPAEYLFMGQPCEVDIYRLTLQEAALTASADCFVDIGREFIERLNRAGSGGPPVAADDDNHNRYLGISLAMAQNGMLIKAASFYNRWAALCKRLPLRPVSYKPPCFTIAGFRITLNGTSDIGVSYGH